MRLYSVYDRVAEVYAAPVPAPTDGVAVRNFLKMIENPDVQPYKDDYWLYQIGAFNESTGELYEVGKPRRVFISDAYTSLEVPENG